MNKINYSLSGNNINYLMNKFLPFIKYKIVQYKDIENYASINDLFNGAKVIYLLIDSYIYNNYSYGHWTVLYKKHNDIYFFCSYGKKPLIDHINYIHPDTFKNYYNQQYIYLNKLLYQYSLNHNVFYNNYQLQNYGSNITTCGRWCFYFCYKMSIDKNMDENKFYEIFKNFQNKDIIITILTNKYLLN